MANYYLSRTVGTTNTAQPNATGPYQWVELAYSGVTGGQDVFYAPDPSALQVVLTNTAAGTAQLDYTASPPDVVAAGSALWTNLASVTATTGYPTFQPGTAFRVNITSGNWKVSVRV